MPLNNVLTQQQPRWK